MKKGAIGSIIVATLLFHPVIAMSKQSGSPVVDSEFPNKSLTLIVPFSAGGPTDKLARELSEALRKRLGQNIIVENTGGAGGTIGAMKVVNAKPDGYTLLLAHIGMAIWPEIYKNWGDRTQTGFEYLGLINEVPMTLVGRPTLTANNYPELVSWIKANDGKINLADGGPGSASQLCGLLFQKSIKADMTFIPYKGTAPAIIDLQGGQVDLLCSMTIGTTEHIQDKRVKGYAVTSAVRVATPALAELPTLGELGLEGFKVTAWHGLYAPKNTPPEIVSTLNVALRDVLQDRGFIKLQEDLGALVINDERNTSSGHRKFVESEVKKWSNVLRSANKLP